MRSFKAPIKTDKTWLILVILFLLTFTIRGLFIIETSQIPYFRTPVPGMDIDLHWQAGGLLKAGATQEEPAFELMMCSTPFHPYWLAFWRNIIGDSQFAHRMLNAFLSSFGVLLIFRNVYRMIGSKCIGIICSLFWVALPSLIYFESTLYKSGLELLALNLLLWTVLAAHEHKGKIWIAVIGSMIGFFLLILLWLQMNTFLYPAVIAVFICFNKKLLLKKKCILMATVFLVFGSGFLIYNLRGQSSEVKYAWFMPLKGVHINIGLNEKADGGYTHLAYIPSWPYGHLFHSRMYAETVLGKPLSPEEADWFYIRNAADFILNHPLKALKLVLKKTMLFFNNYEVKGVDDLYYLKNQSRVLACFPFGLGVIVVFSGLGALHLIHLKEYRRFFLLTGLLASILAGNIMTFVTWRYRLESIIPLILLASYGISFARIKTIRLFRNKSSKEKIVSGYVWKVALPMCLCAVVAFYPVVGKSSQSYYKQAGINDSLSKKAESLIRKLERINQESSPSAQSLIQKADILNKLHRHTQAYRILLTINKRKLHTHDTAILYLRYLIWLGEYDKAWQFLNDVKEMLPGVPEIADTKLKGIEKLVYREFIAKVRSPKQKGVDLFRRTPL